MSSNRVFVSPSADINGTYATADSIYRDNQLAGFGGPITLTPATPAPGDSGVRTIVYEHPMSNRSVLGFNRATLSWNIRTPPGTGAWFEVRAWRASPADNVAGWTPWLLIGEWGDVTPEQAGWAIQTKAANATIETDEFVSGVPWDAIQWRMVAASRSPGTSVTLVRAQVTAVQDSFHGRRSWAEIASHPVAPFELTIPFRSQRTDNPALSGRLCSPTSVAMALAYCGVDVPVQRVAELAYDRRHDIYGNWPRNVQAAFELGVPCRFVRFNNWGEVADAVRRRRPVVISFAADKGELPEAPYESTSGHLIVIRGFDADGDVLVNDPACPTAADGARTYSRARLTQVWLRNSRGTAYLFDRDASFDRPLPASELGDPASQKGPP